MKRGRGLQTANFAERTELILTVRHIRQTHHE